MILADTSIWIDHFRSADAQFTELLVADRIATHPMVVEELALGNLGRPATRDGVLSRLALLARPPVAAHGELLEFIDRRQLWATGLDLVDAHLLASTVLTPGGVLWTRDRVLAAQAEKLGVAYRGA